MGLGWRDSLVFLAAALLRIGLVLLFPSWAQILTTRVEIATPVTSFKRLQEGVFLYKNGISPFDGGIYHQAPLLLPLFSNLEQNFGSPSTGIIRYIIVDLLSAQALLQIASSGEALQSRLFKSSRAAKRWSSTSIAAAFLFNPLTVVSCIGRPLNVFTNCAILQALARATIGDSIGSLLALSTASYLSLYPILLLPPILLLLSDRRKVKDDRIDIVPYALQNIGVFAGFSLGFLVISYFVTGMSWQYLASTYGAQIMLEDLTPNIGLWWYFFIEMFDSFRNFFLSVFWLHMISYVPGMTIRTRSQPLFTIVTLLGIFAIFKPYPSVADAALYFALLPLYSHVFPLLRYGFVSAAALMYASFLGPAFYHLWIYAGSGNANFFYAITLVWGLGMIIIVADMLYAVLRDEAECDRPELVDKDLRQI